MVVTLGTTLPAPTRHDRVAGHRFRDDIQGLRAVAVLAVLGFHAGVPGLSGGFVGVDVFFVISGYLITGLILREVAATGRLDLAGFYARRARRLLPATAVVLAAVAALTVWALPPTRWPSVAGDLIASSLYALNWRLAALSTEYLGAEEAASPLLHFWSLAVEEQFYVIWPVLIIGLLIVRSRTGWGLRRVLLGGLALIAVPSLVWSVSLTVESPGPAYFVSTTRAWELAIGATLAITAPRVPRIVGQGLGWAGLAAIGVAVCGYDAGTPFPGIAALLPTLGAAACIVAGAADRRTGASAALAIAPMRGIGTLSYSLYLWHWPLLVAATARWAPSDGKLDGWLAVVVVSAAAVPAWLTYRLVEGPLHRAARFAAPRPALALAAVCIAVGVGAGGLVAVSVPHRAAHVADAAGAAVLGDQPAEDPDGAVLDTVESITPDPLTAADDRGGIGGRRCMHDYDDTSLQPCVYGPSDATTTVAVVGDSKMHQWLPAIERISDTRGWRVITMLQSACPLSRLPAVHSDRTGYENCATINAQRYRELLTNRDIDYVITTQRQNRAFLPNLSGPEQETAMVADLRRTWTELERAGRHVVVVLDHPSPPFNVVECVATHPDKLSNCAFPRARGEATSGAAAQRRALRGMTGIGVVDLRDWICPREACAAVIGNVLVYRTGSHLTTAYIRTLTPRLDAALRTAMKRTRERAG